MVNVVLVIFQVKMSTCWGGGVSPTLTIEFLFVSFGCLLAHLSLSIYKYTVLTHGMTMCNDILGYVRSEL